MGSVHPPQKTPTIQGLFVSKRDEKEFAVLLIIGTIAVGWLLKSNVIDKPDPPRPQPQPKPPKPKPRNPIPDPPIPIPDPPIPIPDPPIPIPDPPRPQPKGEELDSTPYGIELFVERANGWRPYPKPLPPEVHDRALYFSEHNPEGTSFIEEDPLDAPNKVKYKVNGWH